MAISRSDYSAEGWGRVLQDRWDRLQQLVDSGQLERHPLAESWNQHSKLLRDARRAKDGGNDPGEIEPHASPTPAADDDDPPANAVTHGVTGGPREGAELAAHDRAVDQRIRNIEATAAIIPSYRRLP